MTQYEYKIVELELPEDLSAAVAHAFLGNPLNPQQRQNLNTFVEKKLNELGKNGWLLHNSGLATIPTLLVYKTKGARNVR